MLVILKSHRWLLAFNGPFGVINTYGFDNKTLSNYQKYLQFIVCQRKPKCETWIFIS